MIEILDKVNTCKKVSNDIDMVIHPLNKETTFLKDVGLKNKKIAGIIFDDDGSTLILYKKLGLLKRKIIKLKEMFKK